MDREQRRKQLEEKRKRLQQLRELKEERKKSQNAREGARDTSLPDTTSSKPETPKDKNLDTFIDQLLQAPIPGDEEKQVEPNPPKVATSPPPAPVVLKCVENIAQVNITPKPVELYTKEMQTDPMVEVPLPRERSRTMSIPLSESLPPKAQQEVVEEVAQPESEQALAPLEEAEKQAIEQSIEFGNFLRESVRIAERAIQQNHSFDVGIDFAGDSRAQGEENTEVIKPQQQFLDSRYSRDRTVNCLEWSPHHDELFLVAYNKRSTTAASATDWSLSSDPDGVVLLWSLNMPDRPEYTFTCQSEVHTATFCEFNPSLLLGGTYSGEVELWDLRAKSTPVQRSLLSSEGHTHPVFSMCVVGSANAHSAVSLSTDGKLCLWALNNMSTPTESRCLTHGKMDIAGTSLAFPKGEMNEFAIGGEDGSVYRGHIHGNNAGITSAHDGHYGPVTAIDFYQASNATSDLLLSSSMDYSIKLWSHRHTEKSIYTFTSSSDYVYDVAWSPTNPGIFASCDGTGSFEIWNMLEDLEVPVATHKSSSDVAYSRIKWSLDGKKVLLGNAAGMTTLVDIAENITAQKPNDQMDFEALITDLVDQEQNETAS